MPILRNPSLAIFYLPQVLRPAQVAPAVQVLVATQVLLYVVPVDWPRITVRNYILSPLHSEGKDVDLVMKTLLTINNITYINRAKRIDNIKVKPRKGKASSTFKNIWTWVKTA